MCSSEGNLIATLLALSHFLIIEGLSFAGFLSQFLMNSSYATDLASHQTLLVKVNLSSPSHDLLSLFAGFLETLFQKKAQCLTALLDSLSLSSGVRWSLRRSFTACLIASDLEGYKPLLCNSARHWI
jgi:hypothetical protein